MTETEQIADHEIRIRKLEESDIKQQMQLQEIKTSQVEIKNMLLENKASADDRMDGYVKTITDTLTNAVKGAVSTHNNVELLSNKQFWLILGGFGTALTLIITLIGKLIK